MHNLLNKYASEEIIEVLTPYLTEERMHRIDDVLSKRIISVHVAIESPYDVHNGLAIVRSAEAMGVSNVHFINAELKKGQGRATTRGTLKWTHLKRHQTLTDFMKQKGDLKVAGACLEGSVSLEELPVDKPLCFLFGNENTGLTDEAKNQCDLLYRVPMYGMVESYNLSVSAAITLYDYLKRKRKNMGKNGDLDGKEYLEEKAHFYVRSIGEETACALLARRLP